MTAVPHDQTPAPPRWRWINLPWLALIALYRVTLSPLMGGHCRFQPTCSRYARDAFTHLNPFTAARLTLYRVLRCHPWGGSGFDPVPMPGHPPRQSPEPRRDHA